MNKIKYIEIFYNKKAYKVNKIKISKILSILEGKELKNLDDIKIKNLIKKHLLYDEVFLENVNKI